jgi:hypothetical protein
MPTSDADRELLDLQRSVLTSPQGGLIGVNEQVTPQAIRRFEQRQAAQREAYGQFVANSPIFYGNAQVFAPGAQVPLEHVLRFNLEELEMVDRIATPEMARMGRVFTDDEFRRANPHAVRRMEQQAEASALEVDPRGGFAEMQARGARDTLAEQMLVRREAVARQIDEARADELAQRADQAGQGSDAGTDEKPGAATSAEGEEPAQQTGGRGGKRRGGRDSDKTGSE